MELWTHLRVRGWLTVRIAFFLTAPVAVVVSGINEYAVERKSRTVRTTELARSHLSIKKV